MTTVRPLVLTETKLVPPIASDSSMSRPGLLDRIDRAMPVRLVTLVAPAGYGKTTVLADWARQLQSPVSIGWLSLDERDADPVQFWSYVAACAGNLGAPIDRALLTRIRQNPTCWTDVSAVIAESLVGCGDRQVIVFDDLHRIGNVELVDSIPEFIEALPSSVTVIVASRRRLGWPLDGLRSRGEILELNADLLGFDLGETAAVLDEIVARSALDPQAIETIQARTGGWPAVVRLAAVGIDGSREPSRLIGGLSGRSRMVSGFLVEEVLDGLRPELRAFLLDMSIVDRFNVSLARAVTRPDSLSLIRELESDGIIIERDGQLHSYESHPMVRDVLIAELELQSPGRVPGLHLSAAQWFERQRATSRAVEHFMAAGAFDDAMRLIGRLTDAYCADGRGQDLLQWLDLFPAEEIARRPAAACCTARAMISLGRFDEAQGWIATADRIARSDRHRLDVLVARGHLERGRGDAKALLAQICAMDDLVATAADPDVVALAARRQIDGWFLASAAHEVRGDDDRRRASCAGFEERKAGATPEVAAVCGLETARYRAEDGELQSAELEVEAGLRLMSRRGMEKHHSVGHAHVARARVAWCRGLLPEAADALQEAADLHRGETAHLRAIRFVCAADVLASAGRHEQADSMLEYALRAPASAVVPAELRTWVSAWALWVCAAHGRAAQARPWLDIVEQLGSIEDLPPAPWARAMMMGRQHRRVIERFGTDGRGLPTHHLPMIRCGLVLEAALRVERKLQQAETLAVALLAAAERQGIRQPLIDEPTILHRYDLTRAEPDVRQFVAQLRGSARAENPEVSHGNDGLVDGLTARELDVIRRLPTRMTNKEIADDLFVTLNTVKSHLRTIYRKLGVTSRQEAIERCRSIGFL